MDNAVAIDQKYDRASDEESVETARGQAAPVQIVAEEHGGNHQDEGIGRVEVRVTHHTKQEGKRRP